MTKGINLNKNQSNMKAKQAKLIDLLKASKENAEEFALTQHSEQAHINTQQEILDLKSKISQQDTVINNALVAAPFSASKLYAARKEKQLLELKLTGLEEILKELF